MGKGEWLEIKDGERGSSHIMKALQLVEQECARDLVSAYIKWLQTLDVYSQ